MNQGGNPEADVALWMLAQLSPESQDGVRRRLARRLNPPASPRERRERELGAAVNLLRTLKPRTGWSFAYLPRVDYDAQRPAEAPSSASLVAKYGSWVQVCSYAYELVAQQRGEPIRLSPVPAKRQRLGRRYSKQDAATALCECADGLGRAPAEEAYKRWWAVTQRRRPTTPYPSARTIARLYADRGRWRAALEDAELIAHPTNTVRVVARDREQAVELAAALRAHGVSAAHAATRNWIEIYGVTLAEARSAIIAHGVELVDAVTLWDPRTKQLERLHRPNPGR